MTSFQANVVEPGKQGQTPTRTASVRVFLRGSDSEPLDGILGTIGTLLGLDVYKTSLLNQRARIEMKSAALVLSVIFFFDLGAWALLFNTLFHAEILAIDGWSILALLGGFLFASAILLYERQFFTTDVWNGWRGVAWPMAARLTVIIASALVTAQPVELLFFKEAVAYRAHEEGIRLEVVTRRKELGRINRQLEELRAQVEALPDLAKKQPEWEEYQGARQQVSSLREKETLLKSDVARAEGNESHWRAEAARRRKELIAARARGVEQAQAAEASLRSAEAARRLWLDRLGTYRSQLRAVQGQLPGAEKEVEVTSVNFEEVRDRLEKVLDAKILAVREQETRIERWVRQLRQAKPGDPEPIRELQKEQEEVSSASSGTPSTAPAPQDPVGSIWEYRLPDYHFFRQLRVLKDLRAGNPPLWEGISTSEARRLGDQYGLEDVRPCPSKSLAAQPAGRSAEACDEIRWQRHRQETFIYFWSWLVVYGVAFVIPMLVIAMKLLMPRELKAYYSAHCQALAGSPDAIAFQEIVREAGRSEERA